MEGPMQNGVADGTFVRHRVIGSHRPKPKCRSKALSFGQAFPTLTDEPPMTKVTAVPLSTKVGFANVQVRSGSAGSIRRPDPRDFANR